MAYKPQSRTAGKARREYDRARGTSTERGYDHRWRVFSERYRQDNPTCVWCWEREQRAVPSEEVHHIKKLATHPELKYEQTNLVALCEACHKTITAQGG